MSTRPTAASMRGVNVAVTPPWRMNVPSCTLRTLSTFGLNVTVSVIVDSRDALLTESGTVDGPLATRISGGAVTITCVGAGPEIAPGEAGLTPAASRGGGPGAFGAGGTFGSIGDVAGDAPSGGTDAPAAGA